MKNRKPQELPSSLRSIDIKAVLRKRGVYLTQKRNQELKDMAMPIAREMLKGKKVVQKVEDRKHPTYTNEQINEYWEKQIHIVDVIEAQFENKLHQFINQITKGVLSHLDEYVATEKAFKKYGTKDYFDDNEEQLLTKAQLDFRPLLENVAVLAGTEANKLIGETDPYIIYNYRQQIEKNVAKFTQSMIDTDRQHLTDIIVNGLKDGRSVPEIRSEIEKAFNDYNKMQAQRITRTEVIRASNQASLDAFLQSGVVEGKQWVTYGAVDECAEYDGKIETLGGSFYSSDNEFADGDPPLHPNCKCVLIPIVEKAEKTYRPENKQLLAKIQDLEAQVDKRTKEYKQLKELRADDQVYLTALERHLGLDDEPPAKD